MLYVTNTSLRIRVMNLMVGGVVVPVEFFPGKPTKIEDAATIKILKANKYYKALVENKTFEEDDGKTAKSAPVVADEPYVYTDVDSFLDGNVEEVTRRAKYLDASQLQEALTREEAKGKKKRTTLIAAFVEANEKLLAE